MNHAVPFHHSFLAVTFIALVGCGPQSDFDAASQQSGVEYGPADTRAVLALVNDPATTIPRLDEDAGLDRRAATNIVAHRQGPDALDGTDDDDRFDDLSELDAIAYVGDRALNQLLQFAIAEGYLPQVPTGDPDSAALALVNDPRVSALILDEDVGLDKRAANNIVDHRQGPDGRDGTSDDDRFDTLAELDAIPYVGTTALDLLRRYALTHGYGATTPRRLSEVIFSPRSYESSHLARAEQLIDQAQRSLDIAMYSYSDARIGAALGRAVQRGVAVRFIFETANTDKSAADPFATASGRIEAMGINVRYVNKIMHHKFMIVDGPKADLAAAESATLMSGSGNWSNGAGTRYDENSLIFSGYPELALRFQREFDLLWSHSRDFVADANLSYELSPLSIEDADIDDREDADAYFTSNNFSVAEDSTTFRIVSGRNSIADQLVAAIQGATDSIWIASGHLRSRPIAEALMAARAERPNLDIRVYLDGQEYISDWYHNQQVSELEQCLQDAGPSASRARACTDKGFYFGYEVGLSGIQVRYKYYAYRWHYSYAIQMHHKYMIVDGDEVYTGSYNYSDNAEHNTFENMIALRGADLQPVVDAYEANFLDMWQLERDSGVYPALLQTVANDQEIPLVFSSMALDWDQVTDLKAAIRANCADIDSADFRSRPERHWTCDRR